MNSNQRVDVPWFVTIERFLNPIVQWVLRSSLVIDRLSLADVQALLPITWASMGELTNRHFVGLVNLIPSMGIH